MSIANLFELYNYQEGQTILMENLKLPWVVLLKALLSALHYSISPIGLVNLIISTLILGLNLLKIFIVIIIINITITTTASIITATTITKLFIILKIRDY